MDAASVTRLAAERGLARDPYWRTILHYKPTLFGSYESLVDDPLFFYAKDGKRNPEAELEATIAAFLTPKEEGKTHPTARFPLRYAWLREKLGLDAASFPYDGENDTKKRLEAINAGGVFLVFPAGYMASPASMFGHTFLFVEAAGGSRLLSHSVNYGAMTEDSFGPVYAFKGLFGLYRGYYSFLPYFQKIREYGDIDMRAMWEYELDLTPAERDRLLMHIIEMEGIYSDYYFITENCSYNLLFLIEAARPSTRATEAFIATVEPIQTVKLMDTLGLVKKQDYRPSLNSKVEYQASRLSAEQNAFVRDVCRGRKTPASFPFAGLPDDRKAAIWDLAAEYLKYLLVQRDITESEYRKRLLSILSARKEFGKVDTLKGLPVPPPPHEAHGSRKIAADVGFDGKSPYTDLQFRLTAHDAMDMDPGYTANSQLVVGKVSVRWRYENRELSLRKFDIVDLVSLSKTDAYFFNPCYHVGTGLSMNAAGADSETLTYRFVTRFGLSVVPVSWLQAYFLAGPDAFFSSAYQYVVDLPLGGEAGLIADFGPLKSRLSASLYQTVFAPIHTRFSLSAEGRLALGRNLSLTSHYSWIGDYQAYRHEYGLGLSLFF